MCLQPLLCESYNAQALHRARRGASKPTDIVVTCRDNAAKDLTVGNKRLAHLTLRAPKEPIRHYKC